MSILPMPLEAARDLAPVVSANARLDEAAKTTLLASVIYLQAGQPAGPFVVPTDPAEDEALRLLLERSGAWETARWLVDGDRRDRVRARSAARSRRGRVPLDAVQRRCALRRRRRTGGVSA